MKRIRVCWVTSSALTDDARKKIVQIWKDIQGYVFFHLLSGFTGFPGVVPLSIASVDAKKTTIETFFFS